MGEDTTNLFDNLHVSGEDIRSTDWLAVIRQAEVAQIDYYWTGLFAAARKAKDEENSSAEGVFTLLGAAVSMYYDGSDPSEPFKPLFRANNGRSAALSDFSPQHLEPLGEVYAGIEDSEMKSRLADLLWIRRRDHVAAGVAVAEYLKQAESLFDHVHWTTGFNRLQRAMQISSSLGKKRRERRIVIDFALSTLRKLETLAPTPFTSALIDLLLQYGADDAITLAESATVAAKKAESAPDWMNAGSYWGVAAACYKNASDDDRARTALRAQGEAWVQVGESMAASGVSGLAYDHWVERGFHVLRNAGAPKKRLDAVQARLHALQKTVVQNLQTIEIGVPADPEHEAQVGKVRGRTFRDAITFLAAQASPTPKDRLSEQIKARMVDSVVFSLTGISVRKEDGKVDIQLPPFPRKGSPPDDVMDLYMWRLTAVSQSAPALTIESATRIVSEEHPWEDGMLDWLVSSNLFVPDGRAAIYERGLKAGLEGDYLVASHLLIPQLENSFRYVLNQRGIITTFVRQDGTYDEHPLTALAKSEEFAQAFGADLSFAIRGLLTERAGSNLRNNVCHGLVSSGSFYQASNICLFGLTLLLLLHGLAEPNNDGGEIGSR